MTGGTTKSVMRMAVASKPEETKAIEQDRRPSDRRGPEVWHEAPRRGESRCLSATPKSSNGAPSVSRRRVPACMRCKRSSDSVACDPGQRDLAMSVAINEGIAKGGAGRHRFMRNPRTSVSPELRHTMRCGSELSPRLILSSMLMFPSVLLVVILILGLPFKAGEIRLPRLVHQGAKGQGIARLPNPLVQASYLSWW